MEQEKQASVIYAARASARTLAGLRLCRRGSLAHQAKIVD